ncbi:DUF1569 domain-containing protein [Mucilaginibacter sp.]
MALSADINNREELRETLNRLQPQTKPLWGNMTARQMTAHLVDMLQLSNGVQTDVCRSTADEAAQSKQIWVYTDAQIPKNLILQTLLSDHLYPDLATAVDQLTQELNTFDQYYAIPKNAAIHGSFGALNRQEWVLWHNKHFTHHFKQFLLL